MAKPIDRSRKGASVAPVAGMATSPPDGWALHSPKYGFMRTDTGQNLVSLIELVQWLMQARKTHRPGAMRIMLDAITADALPCIYFTERDAPPAAYSDVYGGPWAALGPEVPSRFQDAHRAGRADPEFQRWQLQSKADQEADLLKERITAEVLYWLDKPGELADQATTKAVVSILTDKAGELWGYGQAVQSSTADAQPSTWPELVAYRKLHPGGPWTPEMLTVLATVKDARGMGAAAALAGELGVSVEAVNAALRRYRKRQPASTAGRVFRVAGNAK
jgi:hypothetical protein